MNIENFIFELTIASLERKGDSWNGRCPVCGDSNTNQYKKRFWIKPDHRSGNGDYFVKCYNCGYYRKFKVFLKEHYPELYRQFLRIAYKERNLSRSERVILPPPKKVEVNNNLQHVDKFSEDHISQQFFKDRKIPCIWKKYLFYTDNFKSWINEKIPGQFEHVGEYDKRIVIPFYTVDRKLFAVAGRALEDNKPRYMTIKFDKEQPKIFGLERVNFEKPIYVFEGPIDSLFIPNSIATGGSLSGLQKLLDYAPKENYIIVPDIEPRNREVVAFIEDALTNGFKVSLFDKQMKKYGKDINDIIKNSNLTWKPLLDIINSNIIEGKKGLFKVKTWKRIKTKNDVHKRRTKGQ